MIDNAAMASQNKSLIDSEYTREAIFLNIIKPMLAQVERLEAINAELLTACEQALDDYHYIKNQEQLIAAIAKAKGGEQDED